MTHRNYICTVSLENISIDIRTRLVDGVALQGLRRLTKLQVESNAISSFGCDVGIEGENEIGLIDAEDIAEDVVSANIIGATWWSVEVVFIIAIEHIVDCGSAGQRRREDRRRGRGCYITRASSLNRGGLSCSRLSNVRGCADQRCGGFRSAGAFGRSLRFQLAILSFERSHPRLQVDDHLFQLSDFIIV